MASVFQRSIVKSIPEGAELFKEKGERRARWTSGGRTRTAPVNKGGTGILVPAGNWIASWFDHNGDRRELTTGTTDRRLAERIAQRWGDAAVARKTGLIDARAEAVALQEVRPLTDHLADFLTYLGDKGTTGKQIAMIEARLRKIIEHAMAAQVADLSPSNVLAAIQHYRTPGAESADGISCQTATHYVRAIKSFSRWMVRDKRASADALAHLAGFNAETDRRRVRRDLSADELARLIDAAMESPTVTVQRPQRDAATKERRLVAVRMTAPERAWAYRIAAGTGFRASEVSSITPESFDLDADTPTVTVEACYSKRKRRDVQPIRADLADLLRPWLATRPKGAPVSPLPDGKAALLLRADLAVARATWIDEARTPWELEEREKSDHLRYIDSTGRYADFHSLRHGYISRIVESGASVKVAQELARHSDPKLTIGRYAHTRLFDLGAALDSLPGTDRPKPETQQVRATGTNGRMERLSHQSSASYPSRRCPQKGPHSLCVSGLVGASGCATDSADTNEADSPNPVQIKGQRESMRTDATESESAPGQTRTADLRFRKPPLYPAELRAPRVNHRDAPPAPAVDWL